MTNVLMCEEESDVDGSEDDFEDALENNIVSPEDANPACASKDLEDAMAKKKYHRKDLVVPNMFPNHDFQARTVQSILKFHTKCTTLVHVM